MSTFERPEQSLESGKPEPERTNIENQGAKSLTDPGSISAFKAMTDRASQDALKGGAFATKDDRLLASALDPAQQSQTGDHTVNPLVKSIDTALKAGNKEEALKQAEKIANRSVNEATMGGTKNGGYPNVKHAGILNQIGHEFGHHQQWSTAEDYYRRGIEESEDYYSNKPEQRNTSQSLAKQYTDAGLAQSMQGNKWDASKDSYKKAAEIYENMHKQQGNKMSSSNLMDMQYCYSNYMNSIKNANGNLETSEYRAAEKRFYEIDKELQQSFKNGR